MITQEKRQQIGADVMQVIAQHYPAGHAPAMVVIWHAADEEGSNWITNCLDQSVVRLLADTTVAAVMVLPKPEGPKLS